nr:hypothetical protein [Tanacetum cinerariifolium]
MLSTQEYMKKAVEDVGNDGDFKSGSWVSPSKSVNANGGISCTPNALSDLTVTMKELSEEEIVKLIEEDEMADFELQDCGNATHQEMADEEALNLALEEEARQAWANQEWLEKCRQEEVLDEEHERQLWGFYETI